MTVSRNLERGFQGVSRATGACVFDTSFVTYGRKGAQQQADEGRGAFLKRDPKQFCF
jgi:hypothetical protein